MKSIWNTHPPQDCIKLIRDKLKYDVELEYYDLIPPEPYLIPPDIYDMLLKSRKYAVKFGLVDEIYFDWVDKLQRSSK